MKDAIRITSVLVAAVVLLTLSPTAAEAVPPVPSSFYGTVKLNGSNMPDGTKVSAWIGGVKYCETETETWEGDSVYFMDVPGDDPETPEKDGGVEGETIVFKIASYTADQTGTWHSGTNVELNLTAAEGTVTVTPTSTFTPTPTNTPTRTPTPTPTGPSPTPTPTPTGTRTPIAPFRIYLPLILKNYSPGSQPPITRTPTRTPTPSRTPTRTPKPGITNLHMSDSCDGPDMILFPAGTETVYVVFDYSEMQGELYRIAVADGVTLYDASHSYTGSGTECIPITYAYGPIPLGQYRTQIVKDGFVEGTVNWSVVPGSQTPTHTPTRTPTPTPRPVKFTDVTLSSGISDPGYGNGIAFADYDNDHDLDIYVSDGGTLSDNHLFRNNGNGSFTEVAGVAGVNDSGDGHGTAFGDYDNDGDLDLYVANWFRNSVLYRNNGNGTFTDVTSTAGVGDTGLPVGIVWLDYNNDGFLDLYVVNQTRANALFRNNGNGTFTDVAVSAGVIGIGTGEGASAGDYDNDGDLDLYVANGAGPNMLFRNNGNGTFTNVATLAGVDDSESSRGAVWGDYDNDGDLDLYVVNWGPNRLYRNNGNGTFTDVAASAGVVNDANGHGAAFGDYDNNGYLDLHVANGVLYRNRGDGTFEEVSTTARVTAWGITSAWGDYNNDGYLDLYIAGPGEDHLYQNEGTSNFWLKLILIGTESNRSAIGTRVTLYAGANTQIREVGSGSGYGSQDSLTVEFGLGQSVPSGGIDIQITWPSGAVQSLSNLAANQTITLAEPSMPPLSKRVLFDEGHGEGTSILTNYREFADNLRSNGYLVDRVATRPITYETLNDYEVFVVGNASIAFDASEVNAIIRFVQEGGGLFLAAQAWWWASSDEGHTLDNFPPNVVGSNFGIRFLDDAIYDPSSYYPGCTCTPIFYPAIGHQVLLGVSSFGGPVVSSPITTTSTTSFPILCGSASSYSNGGNFAVGTFPPTVVAALYGSGRVVALGHEGYLSTDDYDGNGTVT